MAKARRFSTWNEQMKSLRAQHAEKDNKEISDLKKWRTERTEAVFRQYLTNERTTMTAGENKVDDKKGLSSYLSPENVLNITTGIKPVCSLEMRFPLLLYLATML